MSDAISLAGFTVVNTCPADGEPLVQGQILKKIMFPLGLVAMNFAWATLAQGQESTITPNGPAASTSSTLSTTASSAKKPEDKKAEEDKKTSAKLLVSVGGSRKEDEFMRANSGSSFLEFTGEAKVSKSLTAKLDIAAQWATGLSNSQYKDSGVPVTGLFFGYAYLDWNAFSELYLRGGVLETAFSDNNSIFFPDGFPGIGESYKIGGDRLNLTLTSSQTIPTAAGGASRNFKQEEETPYLFLNTAAVQAGEKDDRLSANVSLTNFTFGNLSAVAAADSVGAGNTTRPVTKTIREFTYRFYGYETAMNLKSRLDRHYRLDLRTSALINQGAPDGANFGYSVSFQPSWENDALVFKPEIGYYVTQSDTLPAAYTSPYYGNNGRQGMMAGLRVQVKDPNMTFKARWVQANEIEDRKDFADRTLISIGVETTYDLL